MRYRVGNRISAQGETTNPTHIRLSFPECFEGNLPHEKLTLRRHRGFAAIHVVRRTGSAGQGKVSHDQGAFEKQRAEA